MDRDDPHLGRREYMIFPRLISIAEIGWSKAADRDWNEYRVRLARAGAEAGRVENQLLPLPAGRVEMKAPDASKPEGKLRPDPSACWRKSR